MERTNSDMDDSPDTSLSFVSLEDLLDGFRRGQVDVVEVDGFHVRLSVYCIVQKVRYPTGFER